MRIRTCLLLLCLATAIPTTVHARSTVKMVQEYRASRPPQTRAKLQRFFLRNPEHGNKDVYNPTAPFKAGSKTVIAARVESPHSESDSKVHFFEKTGKNRWTELHDAPQFDLQDPFISKVHGEVVFGGVRIHHKPDGTLGYRTVFYRGSSLHDLKEFAAGPEGMKDIRITGLRNGKIAVLTRPQGGEAGPGRIGFTVVDRLEDLARPDTIAKAPILHGIFDGKDWGGANELHVLDDDTIGVLGHVARYDEAKDRHYYPMAFTINVRTGEVSQPKVLFERADLKEHGELVAKKPDLKDVLFTGGMKKNKDGTVTVYVGVGDVRVAKKRIADPFHGLWR